MNKYKSNVMAMFRTLDKDCSGALDMEELKAAFSSLGFHTSDKEWRVICKILDADGNGEVEYEELSNAMKHYLRHGERLLTSKILNLNLILKIPVGESNLIPNLVPSSPHLNSNIKRRKNAAPYKGMPVTARPSLRSSHYDKMLEEIQEKKQVS